jgi:hypothetical protein
MAKVYSLHMIAIKAGASGEDFERYFREEFLTSPQLPGVKWRLLRGDRGDRAGKYLLMIEVESASRRTYLFPVPGPSSPEAADELKQWVGVMGAVLARWDQYATPFDVIFTDYVDVSG